MAALEKQIDDIYLRNTGGGTWSYTFKGSNFDINLEQVNYTGNAFDEAIDGSLRSNIRGYRLNVSLRWDAVISTTVSGSSVIRDFLDDMVTSIDGGDDAIDISFNNSNWTKVVPDGSTLGTAYESQIGIGNFDITLIGQEIFNLTNDFFDSP